VPPCKDERRPLLDLLGVEPGRISGSLARLLALLAVVAPYTLAAHLAWLLWGVKISPMGVWKVVQRLGESAAGYSEGMSRYHADSRSEGASTREAPPAVVLSVDGSMLGMQVRKQRRRRTGAEPLPPLPPVKEGQFQEVKTGVLLLPSERVETSPGRHTVVRRFLVSCLGDADATFARLYAQLRELGWLDTANTVVVIVGDGAEWIWNRSKMFVRRCEILDYGHALELRRSSCTASRFLAKNYIDNLREEVQKGLHTKAAQGLYPSYAPLGYLNVVGPDGKRIIVHPEPRRARPNHR
jgi:hypothetical protein